MIGPSALAPLVDDLLGHLVAGDVVQAAAVLDHVVGLGDDADVYGLCVAAADEVLPVLQALPPGEGPPCGLLVVPAERADPHRLFAARFLAAAERGDRAAAVALFRVAAEAEAAPQALTESVCALLALVSALLRGTHPNTPDLERT
ncbi:hypothetical protein ACFV1C_00415 [Streptomyces sp. NPDC059605]|uniref:hypothetical protein n=1 Tax=Streptomyces sp. NPDC059605 TaxID=3346882 RepID=UPI00368FDC48